MYIYFFLLPYSIAFDYIAKEIYFLYKNTNWLMDKQGRPMDIILYKNT